MAYGTARMRAYYGAGDYSSGLALRQAYTGAYYPAGGFFSSLGSFAKKAAGIVGKVASNPLVSAGLSFLPFGGIAGKAAGLVSKFAAPIKAAGKVAAAAGVGALGAGLANRIAFGSGPAAGVSLPSFAPGGGGGGGTRRRTTRRRTTRRRRASGGRTRRRSRRRPAGDSRFPNGEFVSGGSKYKRRGSAGGPPMTYPHHGHYHPPKRRRRGGGGGKVSFTTKDGRRVSFMARGDA